jgi:hypothetical protein
MPKTINRDASLSGHLDPDTLAAYAERALGKRELGAMFAHVAECQPCRDWFGVYTELGCDGQNTSKASGRPVGFFAPAAFYLKTAAGIAFAIFLTGVLSWTTLHERNGSTVTLESGIHSDGDIEPPSVKSSASRIGPALTVSRHHRRPAPGPLLVAATNSVRQGAVVDSGPSGLRPVTFRLCASDFIPLPKRQRSILPPSMAAARLESRVSFLTMRLDAQKHLGDQVHTLPLYERIPIQTALGVRLMSLSLMHE